VQLLEKLNEAQNLARLIIQQNTLTSESPLHLHEPSYLPSYQEILDAFNFEDPYWKEKRSEISLRIIESALQKIFPSGNEDDKKENEEEETEKREGKTSEEENGSKVTGGIVTKERSVALERTKKLVEKFRLLIEDEFNPWKQFQHFCFVGDPATSPYISGFISPTYEFVNQEFVDALAIYLCKRLVEFSESIKEETTVTILEVGAGSGKLIHFLSKQISYLMEQSDLLSFAKEKLQLIACDSSLKWISIFPVKYLDYKDALEEYEPLICICSWMPVGEDWTENFRNTPSIQEYILIGDEICCGHQWKSWGIADDDDENLGKPPPYMRDQFYKEYLDEISQHQICRTDYSVTSDGNHSRTVSFKRE